MLAACRPTLCKGVENGSGTSSDREWNAQSNGGVTPDPYRTYTDLERIAIEPQLGREPVGLNRGMLGRCNPTTLCKSPNGAGSETYGPGQRYPAVEPEDNEADGDGYLLLEEDFENEEQDAATFVAELNTMKDTVRGLRKLLAGLLLLVLLLGLSVAFSVYSALPSAEKQETKVTTLLCSIPIVACLFTWFHIWLAIQMMFLPINFFGLYQYGNTGMGIGWQGIVPRKAHKMASTAYVSARPYLDGPRDWLTRVDSKGLIDQIRPQLHDLVKDSLAKVLITHFPTTSSFISDNMRANIATNAVDKIQASSNVLWGKWMDLLCDPDIGVDNDGLIVKIFTENKLLLNDFFMKLGAREFKFIEHCGATMGFFCGLMQLIAFNNMSPVGRAFFLPLSGFFLGIISNWAAITCVFKPCYPVPVRICGYHICDIQGLFLKRQQDVAVLYSKLLCEHFLNFPKIVNHLNSKPILWARLRDEYVDYNAKVMKETLGVLTTTLSPLMLGKEQFSKVESDLTKELVLNLRKATEIHKIGGKYIGKVSNVEANNTRSLKGMPPDEFENLLHPVFQEDEWILILLGGILGMIVGTAQVFFLRI